jgi:hypothetical protein
MVLLAVLGGGVDANSGEFAAAQDADDSRGSLSPGGVGVGLRSTFSFSPWRTLALRAGLGVQRLLVDYRIGVPDYRGLVRTWDWSFTVHRVEMLLGLGLNLGRHVSLSVDVLIGGFEPDSDTTVTRHHVDEAEGVIDPTTVGLVADSGTYVAVGLSIHP